MVLFDNSIIKLVYNPATDILEVGYPDLQGYLITEIKYSINKLVEILKSYDIKKLLLDATRTIISVSDEQSREIASYLATGVMTTRVEKVARLQSLSEKVEKTAQGNIQHIQEKNTLPYKLKNFTDKAEAITWLNKQ